jgi:hypothetical protein
MAEHNFISSKVILNEFKSHLGYTGEINERDIKRWASDAAERFVGASQLYHKLALIRINNYSGSLPEGFDSVVQAAYVVELPEKLKQKEVVEWVKNVAGSDCKIVVSVECPRCGEDSVCTCSDMPLVLDVDQIYASANPDLYTRNMKHFYSSHKVGDTPAASAYNSKFVLMRRTSNSMFGNQYFIPGCININLNSPVEYDIQPPKMILNFDTGWVLLSYLALPLDEEGYRMIPDHPLAIEAVAAFIRERIMSAKFGNTGHPNDRVNHQYAYQLKESAIGRARDNFEFPSMDILWQFVRNHIRKTIPYYNWEQHFDGSKPDRYRPQKY